MYATIWGMVFLSTVCGQSSSMTSEQITSCCLWLVILPPLQFSIPPSFYETNITVTASGECTISVHSITQKGHYWVLGVPSHLSPRKMRVILKNTPMQWLSSWGYLFKSGFTCARNTPYYSKLLTAEVALHPRLPLTESTERKGWGIVASASHMPLPKSPRRASCWRKVGGRKVHRISGLEGTLNHN